MRALTVKQPHAWAIFHAGKDVEAKTWVSDVRGRILIHAAGTYVWYPKFPDGIRKPKGNETIYSAIIGTVDLVDIAKDSSSRWFSAEFWMKAWILENPKLFSMPIPCTGRTGLWYPPAAVMAEVEKQLT